MSGKLSDALRNRSLLLRLLMCLFAVVGMVAVVEGWYATFPYRLGDVAEDGIIARVNFEQLNTFKTREAKAEAATRVPFYFRRDPTLLDGLPAQLRSDFVDIARANSLEELSPETRAAFELSGGLDAGADDDALAEKSNREFQILKAAVRKEEREAGNVIDELVGEFERLMAQLKVFGVADKNELAENDIVDGSKLSIVEQPESVALRIFDPDKVLLDDLFDTTGTLGSSWDQYPELRTINEPITRWIHTQTPITLRYDSQATNEAITEAQERVGNVTDNHVRGEVLVDPGQVLDREAIDVLRAQYDAIESEIPPNQRIARGTTVFFLILVLAVLNGCYIVNNEPRLVRSVGRLAIYLIALVATVAVGRILSADPWRAEVIPLTATVMIFAIAYRQEFATITAFTLALLITISTSAGLGEFVVLMSVATVAIIPLGSVSSRSTLIKVGFLLGAVYFVVSWGMAILQTESTAALFSNTNTLFSSLRGAGWCLVSGYLVAGSLPFIESAFGMVTDISLLEMSDVSHPLLQELVRRAPGTYNHSISVATIGESAADCIGANGLLVRVGAYFHDIGKMLKPQYFIENMTQGAESRHEHLAPAMSTLIIIGHVKDGVDLAHQHNLPQPLVDFIEQHHGTTLVEYFYHEATKQADQQPDHKTDAEESSFRYPGPKPQSREAGVMMLADAVESASRTLSEPTPKRIHGLVHDVTMKRLLDGQFNESSLTLSEIRAVEDSLAKSLIAIYHGRIKYPEQQTA